MRNVCLRQIPPDTPCAIYWARLKVVYYANTRSQVALIGLQYICQEIEFAPNLQTIPFIQILFTEAMYPFHFWSEKMDNRLY
jgi:hypothetical protein